MGRRTWNRKVCTVVCGEAPMSGKNHPTQSTKAWVLIDVIPVFRENRTVLQEKGRKQRGLKSSCGLCFHCFFLYNTGALNNIDHNITNIAKETKRVPLIWFHWQNGDPSASKSHFSEEVAKREPKWEHGVS